MDKNKNNPVNNFQRATRHQGGMDKDGWRE